jgi:uncharacterized protein YkwD
MGEPTALEQYVLELMNRARANPLAEASRLGIDLNQGLAAGTITGTAKAPLAMNGFLVDAAGAHSDWMLATDTFSHTGVNGTSPTHRMTAAGYVLSGSWSTGENIALRTGGLDATTAALLADQLFLSAGHRTNLLSDGFREVGVGLAQGDYDWGGSTGVRLSSDLTQNFARSGNGLFLLGVAFDDADGDHFYDPGEGLGGLTITIRNAATGAATTVAGWSAGGWQASVAAGSYEVTFSGGALPAAVTRGATLGGVNVKLDLDLDAAAAGAQTVNGTTGADTMTGRDGIDRLNGGTGNDWLFGGVGNDALLGAAGADTLLGSLGRDNLNGGAENDLLVGGEGVDVLTGGTGADRFRFLAATDRGDRITDFDAAAGDRVEIDRLVPTAAGTNWATLSASGHVKLTDSAAGAVLWVDANGGADRFYALATFTGLTAAQLSATDFLLA